MTDAKMLAETLCDYYLSERTGNHVGKKIDELESVLNTLLSNDEEITTDDARKKIASAISDWSGDGSDELEAEEMKHAVETAYPEWDNVGYAESIVLLGVTRKVMLKLLSRYGDDRNSVGDDRDEDELLVDGIMKMASSIRLLKDDVKRKEQKISKLKEENRQLLCAMSPDEF